MQKQKVLKVELTRGPEAQGKVNERKHRPECLDSFSPMASKQEMVALLKEYFRHLSKQILVQIL